VPLAQRGEAKPAQHAWEHDGDRVRPGNPAQASATQPGAGRSGASRVSLTGRGAVLLMLTAFTAGLFGDTWLGWTTLAGISFVLGAAAAARYTKQADLLTVAATPPLLFFCALTGVKVITAGGNVVLSAAGEDLLTLASVAPWLFAGVALNLIISWWRGLFGCLAQLRGAVDTKHIRTTARRG
jgi:Domain of unknown function (DUF6542)